jgi:vanillate O-demethylase monooxygenase subunit
MSDYLKNAWYMAAWEEEVEGDQRLARQLLDEPWVIYRKEEGGYTILADRCPHRLAPLSLGKREGDALVCPYHGLAFGPGGQCLRNPFSDLIPPNAVVRTVPAVARYGAIWFWPGDPDRADPATIPDFSILDDPKPMHRGRTRFEAHYEIITDNLMDLSHAEFIHKETFRTEGKIFGGTYRASESNDGAIWSRWTMQDTKRPHWLTMIPEEARLDEWLEMRWHAPASMLLHIGFTLAGQGRDAAPVPEMVNPHIITPETQTSSHYFYTCEPDEASKALAVRV